MARNVFHFHQTKRVVPYMSFLAIQKRLSGENATFIFSQGVILVILLPKSPYLFRYINTRHWKMLEYDTEVDFRVGLSY